MNQVKLMSFCLSALLFINAHGGSFEDAKNKLKEVKTKAEEVARKAVDKTRAVEDKLKKSFSEATQQVEEKVNAAVQDLQGAIAAAPPTALPKADAEFAKDLAVLAQKSAEQI
ncbi:MAG: hypothetical protein HRT88_09425 [Lentisphaeraceae bacterium]|nr:hypothetical protein [Lentisphaeraceae bacterium]